MDHVEAVVEVLAEAPGGHLRLEVAVGGGDDADVAAERPGVADGRVLPLLEEAEELDLERQGQLAYLVEEERAALGRARRGPGARVGAGERALGVPEELALEQRSGMAPQLTVKRRLGARDSRVERRAATSLPVPLSPLTRTVALVRATRSITDMTSRISGLLLIIPGPASTLLRAIIVPPVAGGALVRSRVDWHWNGGRAPILSCSPTYRRLTSPGQGGAARTRPWGAVTRLHEQRRAQAIPRRAVGPSR